MKIGDIEIQGHVVLGPMAGITNLAYREFMKPFGVGLSYSEMISDCGISYQNEKTYTYLATSSIDRPVGLQLFGFSIEHTLKAISIIEKKADYDILDINLGCPVPKVTKTGAGSSWLRHPKELFEYMKAVCKASSKPVTAKIRLGWDQDSINVFEIVDLLQKAGVKAISIHCRTKAQGYSGQADYEAIRGLKEKMTVPLIISGDIFSLEKAIEAVQITKADAVMVARGGEGNPFLITQINHWFETGEKLPSPTLDQQIDYAEQYAKKLIELKGEATAIKELKGIVPHFLSGFPGYKKVRNEIAIYTNSSKQLFALLEGIKSRGGCR